MNEKFDWNKWHKKALEDSKLEGQLFNLIPQSSFEELYDYIAKLVNLVEVQHDDNCHLADMCRQRDASIAELEATIDQLIAAGESLTRVAEWRYANLTELLAWDTLVEKIHKEREK